MIMKKQKVIKTKAYPYPLKIENCDIEDLYANEVVEFVAKSHPNDKIQTKIIGMRPMSSKKNTNDET